MDSDFEKIRRNNCTFYIHKRLVNDSLRQTLLASEEKLRERYVLNTIPSSEFTQVHKFTINDGGVDREVYFKQHFCGSILHFIKYLFRSSRAMRAFKATLMLARNGFDVPTIIAMGECGPGLFHTKSFLATFGVEESKVIYQFIPENRRNLPQEQLRSKRELIRAFGRTIGKMHARGIFHGDLRLGNVLAKRERNSRRFFFLDNERTKKFDRLPFGLRVRNLVQVNMGPRGLVSNTDRMRFFKEYWAENGNGKSGKQKIALIKKIVRRTNRRLSRKSRGGSTLRKCLRANARYLRIKTGKYLAVFDKDFCRGAEPLEFIEQIDRLMKEGQILKDGRTSYVSRIRWNNKDVVVKRYNHKGFIHSLRHTIKGSRARRCWLNGHRLMALNIPTPRPVAFIEERKGVFLWKSYLVTEFVDGPNLWTFLRNDNIAEQQRSRVIDQMGKVLTRLGEHKITHGDLKHTNILITEDGPVLTDLDAMKVYKWMLIYRIRKTKDLSRFLR